MRSIRSLLQGLGLNTLFIFQGHMALVYLKDRLPKHFFPQTIVSAECFAVYHCGSVFWLHTFLEQLSYA